MSLIKVLHAFTVSWILRFTKNNFAWVSDWYMGHLKKYGLSYIWSMLLVSQILLIFVFGILNPEGFRIFSIAGYVCWILSAVFGWLPIFIFRKKGGVAKGKSYVHTTVLVDKGLYAIVRHPQYTAGILLSVGLILISQTWIVAVIGIVCIALMYRDIVMADQHEIRKFGDQYRQYMEKVPRTNFLLGIIRILRQRW
jgi:protein-S-isoprenylcysteine O-methyltransferase Ste14